MYFIEVTITSIMGRRSVGRILHRRPKIHFNVEVELRVTAALVVSGAGRALEADGSPAM